jgi:hypothetical protein
MSENLFIAFRQVAGLMPLRTVATVISASFGRCVVEYPNGARAEVRGAGTPGNRYFIFDGRLDGDAPTLATLEIEV